MSFVFPKIYPILDSSFIPAGNRYGFLTALGESLTGAGVTLLEYRNKSGSEAEILADAKRLGYAEADESLDVEGWDTAHKASILAFLAHGIWVRTDRMIVEGIDRIAPIDLRTADTLGYGIKLLAVIGRDFANNELFVRVHPTLLPREKVLANVNGVFNGVHVFLPRIRAHGEGGHIVNTASMGGILQYSRAGVYVTTKFAVVGLSEALNAELLDENIGVSAFCPGGVRTNIREYEKTRPARYARPEATAAAGGPPAWRMSEEVMKVLGEMSWEPEQVGEMVLEGIRNDSLYIFTSPEFRPGVVERFEAILEQIGDNPELAKRAREHVPNLVSSPIYPASVARLRASRRGSEARS